MSHVTVEQPHFASPDLRINAADAMYAYHCAKRLVTDYGVLDIRPTGRGMEATQVYAWVDTDRLGRRTNNNVSRIGSVANNGVVEWNPSLRFDSHDGSSDASVALTPHSINRGSSDLSIADLADTLGHEAMQREELACEELRELVGGDLAKTHKQDLVALTEGALDYLKPDSHVALSTKIRIALDLIRIRTNDQYRHSSFTIPHRRDYPAGKVVLIDTTSDRYVKWCIQPKDAPSSCVVRFDMRTGALENDTEQRPVPESIVVSLEEDLESTVRAVLNLPERSTSPMDSVSVEQPTLQEATTILAKDLLQDAAIEPMRQAAAGNTHARTVTLQEPGNGQHADLRFKIVEAGCTDNKYGVFRSRALLVGVTDEKGNQAYFRLNDSKPKLIASKEWRRGGSHRAREVFEAFYRCLLTPELSTPLPVGKGEAAQEVFEF